VNGALEWADKVCGSRLPIAVGIENETHPKVLMHARCGQRYDPKDPKTVQAAIQWFADQGHYTELKIEGEHELDAALSAWTTREGLAKGWVDIIGKGDHLIFPAGRVQYLWPEAL
jgi:hypothetical protein